MKKGTLIISLDFELVWGIFDHINIENKVSYFNNTLKVIPEIVNVFGKNEINATWATVGMLFNENWDEWYSNIPKELPMYQNPKLNPYEFGKNNRKENLSKFFFAPKLIQEIQSIKGQEIGTHTYSHYYCLEKGQTINQFEADIQQAVKIANKFKISLESLVFPRNQFNEEYLQICNKYKIQTVRTNPNFWYWDTNKPETLASKIARTGDAYFPFGIKSYSGSTCVENEVFQQKASRFLRPQSKYTLLNSLRLNRIKDEMIYAAKNNEVYHLWWHPHNFGTDSEGAIKALHAIMEMFNFCNEKYGMQSKSMKQFSDDCLKDD